MNDENHSEAAFIGRITAGVTHEMKNVLAIIKESAGLVDDILSLNKEAALPQQERLQRATGNIRQQVDRGVELATRLNKFAHSADEMVGGVDLNEVLDQVIYLTQRFARLKGVSLEVRTQPQPVILVTNPLKVQMFLTACIDIFLSAASKGTTLALEPSQQGSDSVQVAFSYFETQQGSKLCHSDLCALPEWSDLQEVAASLNATIRPDSGPVWLIVTFKKE